MLQTWSDIPMFIGISNIESVEWYELQMLNYEKNVITMYAVGENTFLTTNHIGDEETFYLHVLRFYIPHLSKITLQKHQMGIGIFTMQGSKLPNYCIINRGQDRKICRWVWTGSSNHSSWFSPPSCIGIFIFFDSPRIESF